MSWGRYSRYDSYWPRYVPVAERREKAARQIKKLTKKGQALSPVVIQGRTIARSFWGKGWCDHLESFGDYSNRLPRGRTYVRNGMVCHLDMAPGKVSALVAGTSMYNVSVAVKPLKAKKWASLKKSCRGRIGSLIELLQGRLSDEIMQRVTHRQEGLFPLPGEIEYTCSCPDWASMCKHVAAVMYGIGSRLDEQPELLFRLRGVSHEELIAVEAAAEQLVGPSPRRRAAAGIAVEKLFDLAPDETLETDAESAPAAAPPPEAPRAPRKPKKKKATKKKAAKETKASPFEYTSQAVKQLREKLGLSRAAFARSIRVSSATVYRWESVGGAFVPQSRPRAAIERLWKRIGYR